MRRSILFALKPAAAWSAMPTGLESEGQQVSSLVDRLNTAILDSARHSVAARILIEVRGKGQFGLAQLAVEVMPLEGVVTADETAALLGMPATLPATVRDIDARWRLVMDDWRDAEANLPEPLSVGRALDLLRDPNRPVQSTIALVAAGIRDGLGDRLVQLPCLVASGGQRLVPPSKDSPEAVALEVSTLARELGIVTELHAEHLEETKDAREIIDWLRELGVLLERDRRF